MRSKENQLLLSIGVGRLQIKERATLWSCTETQSKDIELNHQEGVTSCCLTRFFAAFIREHLDELEARFALARWPATRTELKKLEKKRMKEMFG